MKSSAVVSVIPVEVTITIYHPGWENSREITEFRGHMPDKYRPEVRLSPDSLSSLHLAPLD
jgi:hypothetical protein